MNKEIDDSIKFLIAEYERLKLKLKNKIITEEEKETLSKLLIFLDKNK